MMIKNQIFKLNWRVGSCVSGQGAGGKKGKFDFDSLAKATTELCRRKAEAAQRVKQRLIGIRSLNNPGEAINPNAVSCHPTPHREDGAIDFTISQRLTLTPTPRLTSPQNLDPNFAGCSAVTVSYGCGGHACCSGASCSVNGRRQSQQ